MKRMFFLGILCMLFMPMILGGTFYIPEDVTESTIQNLLEKYGEAQQFRIERGIKQVAMLWTEKDGNKEAFVQFCQKHFVAKDDEINNLFEKFSHYYEILWGNANKMLVGLKKYIHLDLGELSEIDSMFGGYDPSAHIEEDLYSNKIAFMIALNFPHYSLQEKTELGDSWSRKEWAYARVGDIFVSRVPAEIIQNLNEVESKASAYMGDYNIYISILSKNANSPYFDQDKKLIHHWGLRDEIKALYANSKGYEKQTVIEKVMNRIIAQEIPIAVVNNKKYKWNPFTNEVWQDDKKVELPREMDCRYQILLNNFLATKKMDPYFPTCSNFVDRTAEMSMEIPMADVEQIFEEFLSHPVAHKVADIIRERLGRKLHAFDIWYTGFKAGSDLSEDMLDALVQSEYPTIEEFKKKIPEILHTLDFDSEKAEEYAKDIVIEPARGAGHAWGPMMRGDKTYLRTRTPREGLNYKGFNTCMHELGHNIEQLMTMNHIDYYMLNGVPNTAFTEAWAFLFQERDLKVLGLDNLNAESKYWNVLDDFWSAREIMGVGLVDIRTWRWMYAHPEATASELREAVMQIARDVWNKYYTCFDTKDEIMLACYTHMIFHSLYLPNYPIGQLIQSQLNKQLEGKVMGEEMERIYLYGRIIPQQWMRHAVGSNITGKPILENVEKAIEILKK
jgi:hypothetical protein